jgi:putative redox protein
MVSEKIFFTNSSGIKLSAYLDRPDNVNDIKHTAVYAHCFTCSKDLKAIANINSSLVDYGIAVLRFDMTGIGESEGDFTETNFDTQIADFLSAAKYLQKNYKAPVLLIGHSLGGTVALFSSEHIPSAKAIVTIASPDEPSNLAKKLSKTRQRAIENGTGETEIGGVKFKFKPEFFDNLESYNLTSFVKQMKIPYLVLHSPVDSYTSFQCAETLFSNANQPKAIISLADIDHLMA